MVSATGINNPRRVRPSAPVESYHLHQQSYQLVCSLNYRHGGSGGHQTSHKLPPVVNELSRQFYSNK